MAASPDGYKHAEVTGKVIRAFYAVYTYFGHGFLERVYQQAMVVELKEMGLRVGAEKPVEVYYKGEEVGHYVADLVVEDCVLIELKAAQRLHSRHEAQLINYLKATRYEVGLLLNFGPRPHVVRKVFDNRRKGQSSWIGK